MAVLATSAAAAAAAMVDCAVVPSAPVPASESVSRTAKVFGEVSLRTSLPTQKVRALQTKDSLIVSSSANTCTVFVIGLDVWVPKL